MNSEIKEEIVYIYLDDIIPNRFQPREVFDEKALKELALSIKEHGVIQPIIVRRVNNKYEIIAGERRYKASALAGLTKIPAIVRDLDDKESSKIALLENLQRKNLNPIEEARTYKKILELDQMTQEDLAKTMGKSQSSVANKIRLLSLSDDVQTALLNEKISERHARALLSLPDGEKQNEMLKDVINNKMTVRALEERINGNTDKKEGQAGTSMNETQNSIKPSFVNDNPLIPTAGLPGDDSDYGKVKIVPPEGSEMEHKPKFINYGEVGAEEQENEFTENDKVADINPESMMENAVDIQKEVTDGPTADLDSLLNIDKNFITPNNDVEANESYMPDDDTKQEEGYITPTEAPKQEASYITPTVSTEHRNPEGSGDYFDVPDFKAMNLNNGMQLPPFLSNQGVGNPEPKQYTVAGLIQEIKNTIDEYKNNGIAVDCDEMNFEKNTQLMIKIEKDN